MEKKPHDLDTLGARPIDDDNETREKVKVRASTARSGRFQSLNVICFSFSFTNQAFAKVGDLSLTDADYRHLVR